MVASLISDYSLQFDQWIVTRPNFDKDASAERKRWIGILKTSLTYAIAEPLWYWLMTSISNISVWWLLMGCFLHLQSIPSATLMMCQCILDTLNKHREICGDTTKLAKEEEGGFNESTEKSQPELPKSVLEVDDDKHAPPKDDLRPCMDRHPMAKSYALAPIIPTVTAAMANAGLLFYTRYLSTEDSKGWYDGFAFGWFVIAVLCAFCLVFSRMNNKMMHDTCGRPFQLWGSVPWDILKYRLVAIALIILVRAAVRVLLSQDPFTWFSRAPDGTIYLLGSVDTSDRPGTSLDNKEHFFDRMLSALPPWVGTAISIANCVGIWGYIFYRRWQKKKQQRAEQQTTECIEKEKP